MPRDLDWMVLHAEALYTHDEAGRIVRVNEHEGAPAPRFFVGATADGLVRRYRYDAGDALRRELERASPAPRHGRTQGPAALLRARPFSISATFIVSTSCAAEAQWMHGLSE